MKFLGHLWLCSLLLSSMVLASCAGPRIAPSIPTEPAEPTEQAAETSEEAVSFDLSADGSYVVILPSWELGARMVGEDTIIFTEVHIDVDGTRTPFDFPPAKIKRGAPEFH